MKKYWTIFTTEWMRLLELRLDFWMGRAIAIVTLLTNYFLWTTVFMDRQEVMGYSLEKMLAYVLGVAVLYNVIFVHAQERIGFEIVDGTFATYLVRPVNYFFYAVVVLAGKRVLYCMSILLVIVTALPFLHRVFFQTNVPPLIFFVIATFLAIAIYTLIDYLLGISSFWFYRSFRPRWMMQVLVILASGAAFPIDLYPSWLSATLMATPFPYIIFFPLNVYLGRLDMAHVVQGLLVGVTWVCALAFVTRFLWRRGLRRFEGSGI